MTEKAVQRRSRCWGRGGRCRFVKVKIFLLTKSISSSTCCWCSIFSSLCFSSICWSCSTSILMLVLSNYQIALLLDWYKLTPEKRKPELLIKFASVSQAKRIFPNKSNVGKLDIYLKFSVRYSISIHADLLIVDIIMINTIIDKAPRFSIRRVIWILASDTEYQYLSNSINIHKYWDGNAEYNAEYWQVLICYVTNLV